MKRALLLAVTLVMAACQTPPTQPAHYQHASQITQWQMSGRLGYRTASDGGSANFDWRQRPREGRIHFSGPLGMGSAELSWQSRQATLKTAKGDYQAASPGELAWHLTGFWLPVSALEYWARGLPWPGAPATTAYDDGHRLSHLDQLGWSLDFDRYDTVAGVALPHRIKASQQGNRFTLLIKDWQPGQ
ncbi:molecular chaperone LolB [Alcanivorax hongdengensis A-11-3]|uniref:Outer-membrane lipoprotein LolB n=1 Tax=Alcanivorax hongdengensis A-11-3 TaxID=1177179 RepID=L0WBJ9_9GAMM|nr:lipoprotein insertase outer membrane protein LolB [Alcanivorax hongdengensis]EKF74148.1 molecular chaperone LolB [Alcanivorax hongdengensis A-11-3]